MTYDMIARISQTAALLIFIGLTLSVLAYAFWPGNRQRFDAAQRRALGLGTNDGDRGNRHEQK